MVHDWVPTEDPTGAVVPTVPFTSHPVGAESNTTARKGENTGDAGFSPHSQPCQGSPEDGHLCLHRSAYVQAHPFLKHVQKLNLYK